VEQFDLAIGEINNGLKNLFDVVDDIDTALLVTHTADSIHARPMVIAQLDVARTEE
jgi:general stress protein 26